ncbi:hypothetical protein DEU50_103240 [Aeromonas salmonicida]|uniref:Uncharacterized protein n=1 Tax=Aeromonas salmonicida TaxID=645 RepID=A0AAX1PLI7_AERSA|nr:hypothetical protein DEU50_103240 [Aeromonas salmonicida]
MTTPDLARWRDGWSEPVPCVVLGSCLVYVTTLHRAGCGRSWTRSPNSIPGQPISARFDSMAGRQTPGYDTPPISPAALLASEHGRVSGEPHRGSHPLSPPALGSSAEGCAGSAPRHWRPVACAHRLQAPHATTQRIAAVLATRSELLVDVAPVGIELFFAILAGQPLQGVPCLCGAAPAQAHGYASCQLWLAHYQPVAGLGHCAGPRHTLPARP